MKKNYFVLGLTVISIGFLAFKNSPDSSYSDYDKESHFWSAGGIAPYTGAPGEQNCTFCHAGTVQSGIGEHVFQVMEGFNPVTTYLPGTTYNVSLQKTSDPAKKGFSSTVLDNTATMAGTLNGQGIGGTQDYVNGSRQYVSHTVTSNTNATTTWVWTWDAPATAVGDVTFFVASNSANNNGTASGDVIYTSSHTIFLDSSAAVGEIQHTEQQFFEAGYSPSSHSVVIDFTTLTPGNMFFNLVDMNGRSVFYKHLGDAIIGENHEEVSLPSDLENGVYVVHYFIGNQARTANIMISK